MRHHSKTKKFGRKTGQRNALMNSLVSSLVLHGKIQTTEDKAKALRPIVEKMITNGKKGTLASRREIAKKVGDATAKRIVLTVSPKYSGRAGGYVRITKLVRRQSDGASQAIIEFV